ncbi:MAG TPA: hypothetical protein VJP78_03885, partial [Thermoleophilia bacterium]|nr:hypothetical protein [Thermoleophilia bacterium]
HEPAAAFVEWLPYITEAHRLDIIRFVGVIDEVVELGLALLGDKGDVMTLPDELARDLAHVCPAP